MTWLSWRQVRAQVLVVSGVLLLVAAVLAATGPSLVHLYGTTVVPCAAHGDCQSVTANFIHRSRWDSQLGLVVLAAPALLGIFWGAPLVARELESGSLRLAWTQSVTRTRWIAVKLCLVGLSSMAVAGLLSLMATWWSSPVDRLNDTPFAYFDQRDVVPVAYAAFAFMLGVAAGVVIRRTVPAMAAALVGFVAVRVAVRSWLRPYFQAPLHRTVAFRLPTAGGPVTAASVSGGPHSLPSAWIVSTQIVNPAGKVIGQDGGIGSSGGISFSQGPGGTTNFVGVGRCPNRIPGPGTAPPSGHKQVTSAVAHALAQCVKSFHLRAVLTYQPASRYWPFQWYETAVFLALALALAGFTVWRVRRLS